MPTTTLPNLLRDPGYLLWAPIGSTLPTFTVVGSKFTDAWPVAWLSLGATEDGSEFSYSTKLSPLLVAEFFDPIQWATTDRTGSFTFALANYTLTNLSRAYNGGTLSVVSGSGTTQLNRLTPPTPGTEVRAMLGWESLDGTLRTICYQTINGTDIKSAYKKVPAKATIPCVFNFEIPAAGAPFDMWSAGTGRA
jgi:hypothetical protein